jgi:hypothetical protein
VVVSYGESSEKIVRLLTEVSEEMRHDPDFSDDIVSDIQIPGMTAWAMAKRSTSCSLKPSRIDSGL